VKKRKKKKRGVKKKKKSSPPAEDLPRAQSLRSREKERKKRRKEETKERAGFLAWMACIYEPHRAISSEKGKKKEEDDGLFSSSFRPFDGC